MRTLLLHRHARAGERLADPGHDRLRRLDSVGREDARRLPWLLGSMHVSAIVTSPLRRCVESVQPLAEARGVEIVTDEALSPDASADDTLALLRSVPADTFVCTHREVFERLFEGGVECEKGGTWVVDAGPRGLRATTYVPPASAALRARQRSLLV